MKIDCLFFIFLKVVLLWSFSASAENNNRDFYTFFMGDCHIPVPIEMSVDGNYESDLKFYDSHDVDGEIIRDRSIIASSDFDIGQSALFSSMDRNLIASSGKFKLVRYASSKFKNDFNVLASDSSTGETGLVVMFHNFNDSYALFAYEFCITHSGRQLNKKK